MPNWGDEGDRVCEACSFGARLHLAPLRRSPGSRCFGLAPPPDPADNAPFGDTCDHRGGPPAEPNHYCADAVRTGAMARARSRILAGFPERSGHPSGVEPSF